MVERVVTREEWLEEMATIRRADADAAIGDAKSNLIDSGRLNLDHDRGPIGRELDGVGQKVREYVTDLGGIDLGRAQSRIDAQTRPADFALW